jgi:hypothetical protein
MTTQPIRPAPQPSPPIPDPYLFALRMIIALFLVKAIGIIILVILVIVDNSSLPADLQIELAAEVESPLALATYVILAPLNVIAAIGLWRRKRWAWILTMALLAYSMTLDLVSFFRGQAFYISMLLNVVQVGYLNQQEVQNLFGENRRKTQ